MISKKTKEDTEKQEEKADQQEIFHKFLKMVCLGGDIENRDILVDVKANGLNSYSISSDRVLGLNCSVEGDFSDVGEVGLDELTKMIKYTEAVKRDFKLSFKKDKLILSGANTKISVKLKGGDYVMNKLDPEKFESVYSKTQEGISFVLPKEISKEVVSNFKLVGGPHITMGCSGTRLYFLAKNYSNETELRSEYEVEARTIGSDFKIKVNKYLIDLLDVIDDDVRLDLSKDNPSALAIHYAKSNTTCRYILALIPEKGAKSE